MLNVQIINFVDNKKIRLLESFKWFVLIKSILSISSWIMSCKKDLIVFLKRELTNIIISIIKSFVSLFSFGVSAFQAVLKAMRKCTHHRYAHLLYILLYINDRTNAK